MPMMPPSRRPGTPATISIAATIRAIAIAEPRSGSASTSAQTTAVRSPIGFISSPNVCGAVFFAASSAATVPSSANLASSDGCSVIGPAAIQRRAPLMVAPTPGIITATSSSSETTSASGARRLEQRHRHAHHEQHQQHAADGEDDAVLDEVERVVAVPRRRHRDRARGRVHHHLADGRQAERDQQQQLSLDRQVAPPRARGSPRSARPRRRWFVRPRIEIPREGPDPPPRRHVPVRLGTTAPRAAASARKRSPRAS